jgi:putative addiction module component (TIGR02574 family)
MSPRLKAIEREAARLSAEEKELLAERLMQSLDRAALTEVEESWVKEAERRFAAYRRGPRKAIAAATAFKRMRKGLGR